MGKALSVLAGALLGLLPDWSQGAGLSVVSAGCCGAARETRGATSERGCAHPSAWAPKSAAAACNRLLHCAPPHPSIR